MKTSNETVGFVGFGAMGQLMAEHMFPGSELMAHDPNIATNSQVNGVPMVTLRQAATCETVVLAVPGTEFREALSKAAEHFPIDGVRGEGAYPLLVDISSVKEVPNTFLDVLGCTDQLLACHPLFGPQSAGKTLEGHRVIVTEALGDKATRLLERWRHLGLKIIEMTAEEHDRHMAAVLAIPFMFGRIATSLGLEDPVQLQTPSRLAVRTLEHLDSVQSEELFRTVVECNPHVGPLLDAMAGCIDELRDRWAKSESLALLTLDTEHWAEIQKQVHDRTKNMS